MGTCNHHTFTQIKQSWNLFPLLGLPLDPPFCRNSEFGSSIIPRVCNSHCRKATKSFSGGNSCVPSVVGERSLAVGITNSRFFLSRIRKFGRTIGIIGSKRTEFERGNSAERESVLWQFFLQKHGLLSLLPPHSSQKLSEYPRNLHLSFSYRTFAETLKLKSK